jgi:hypothetical protein
MDQTTTAHEMTGQGINDPVIPINYLHYFLGRRMHDFFYASPLSPYLSCVCLFDKQTSFRATN